MPKEDPVPVPVPVIVDVPVLSPDPVCLGVTEGVLENAPEPLMVAVRLELTVRVPVFVGVPV